MTDTAPASTVPTTKTDEKPAEGHTVPASPPPAETPVTVPPVTQKSDESVSELAGRVDSLTEAVTGLVEKVASLVDVNPHDDEVPTSVPWTHRGSKR